MDEKERAIAVGEFSRLTHLPVKTLHHYHDVGVLVPVLVDPVTGYRRYSPDQVPAAHLARRLRELRMPLAQMRSVLAAPDVAARDAGIAAYLDQVQADLTQTAAAVATLRNLLLGSGNVGNVSYRRLAAQPVLALYAEVQREQIGSWCAETYPRLMQELGQLPTGSAGPGGALYDPGWFEDGGGRVTAFVPIESGRRDSLEHRCAAAGLETAEAPDRVYLTTVPAARVAIALHAGSFADLDLTYGALGREVLDRGLGAEGPIREYYLVTPADTSDERELRTEVCWPITQNH